MTASATEDQVSARQGEVLAAALRLLARDGDRLTMTGVAREASCSKETLYKWFGDREGLLTATVQWQAAKVRLPRLSNDALTLKTLTESMEAFARNLLTVLSSENSVALNRVAVSHAGSDKSQLGAIVLENGRRAMGRRLKPVLEAGQAAGLLAFENSEEAFRSFFGLVVRDVQIRCMLGDKFSLSAKQIELDAHVATRQFLALFGAQQIFHSE